MSIHQSRLFLRCPRQTLCCPGRLRILLKIDDSLFFLLEEPLDDGATLAEPAREDDGFPLVCGGGGGVENELNWGGTPTK